MKGKKSRTTIEYRETNANNYSNYQYFIILLLIEGLVTYVGVS